MKHNRYVLRLDRDHHVGFMPEGAKIVAVTSVGSAYLTLHTLEDSQQRMTSRMIFIFTNDDEMTALRGTFVGVVSTRHNHHYVYESPPE